MPTYQYACGSCGDFEASRPVAEAAAPHPCPECGQLAMRELASPHIRTTGAAIRYTAEARNEKSANEPVTEHRLKGTTAHHHEHARHNHGTHAATPAAHSHRPWMIGH